MIGVDWGTTNFRGYRFDNAGQVIDRRFSAAGILNVKDGRFAETLHEKVGDWIAAGEKHVLLSGMVGSRQGWVEVDYLTCPMKLDDLAAGVVNIPYEKAHVILIPGLRGKDVSGIPEVMRGEETQVMGIAERNLRGGLVCMPGTHTKWIELEEGVIVSFQTCMTGDVFAALRKETILAKLMQADAPPNEEYFLHGVERSADAGGVLHHLFGVRTLALMGELREEAAASYLSGMLIGHEVRAMMPAGASVHIVGAAQLCTLYRRAIESCGGEATIEEEDAAARGLAVIGRRLDWQ